MSEQQPQEDDRSEFPIERGFPIDFEQGKDPKEYLERWNDDQLRDPCEGLTEVTGDKTYLTMVGADRSLDAFGDE